MDSGADGNEDASITPEEAFSLLGNETRVNAIQALADADGPLSFTELRNRVGLRQGAQFNYHLTKLVGHFVAKTDAGYELCEPGRRVVQAVRAGVVEEGPRLERTPVDFDCLFCGSTVEGAYAEGRFELVCASCFIDRDDSGADDGPTPEIRTLTSIPFPPAGMRDRTPLEAMRAAATWVHLDSVAASSGVCPRCSATIEVNVAYCTDHERREGEHCRACGHHHAVRPTFRCTNCTFEDERTGVMALLTEPEMLAFVGEHGLNTTSRGLEWGWDYEEEIRDTDPFEAVLTFTIDGDSRTFVVDESMRVLAVE